MQFRSDDERAFWREVFMALVSVAATVPSASCEADRAVESLRMRQLPAAAPAPPSCRVVALGDHLAVEHDHEAGPCAARPEIEAVFALYQKRIREREAERKRADVLQAEVDRLAVARDGGSERLDEPVRDTVLYLEGGGVDPVTLKLHAQRLRAALDERLRVALGGDGR